MEYVRQIIFFINVGGGHIKDVGLLLWQVGTNGNDENVQQLPNEF